MRAFPHVSRLPLLLYGFWLLAMLLGAVTSIRSVIRAFGFDWKPPSATGAVAAGSMPHHGRLPEMDLALRESFGFFDDVAASDWMLRKSRLHYETYFRFPKDPGRHYHISLAKWLLFNVDPLFSCTHIRKVGGHIDGAKWVCDPHRLKRFKNCLVYSIGSQGNYLFEDGLNDIVGDKHCEIHVFDPNPLYQRPGNAEAKNIHYHDWGLASSYAPPMKNQNTMSEFLALPEILRRLGHVGRRIDIFKIDCEGCEYVTYKDWLNADVDIRQIQIEIHASHKLARNDSTIKLLQAFWDQGFVPFSKEANTLPAVKDAGTLYEFSFLRLAPSFFEFVTESSQ